MTLPWGKYWARKLQEFGEKKTNPDNDSAGKYTERIEEWYLRTLPTITQTSEVSQCGLAVSHMLVIRKAWPSRVLATMHSFIYFLYLWCQPCTTYWVWLWEYRTATKADKEKWRGITCFISLCHSLPSMHTLHTWSHLVKYMMRPTMPSKRHIR